MPEWIGPVASAIFQALETTLWMSLLSVTGSVVLGYILGTLQTIPNKWLVLPIRAYVEFWRALPTVVTLFFIFFLLPTVGMGLPAFTVAVIGLILWGSANVAEVVRGAVQSVPTGQTQAAKALGFGWVRRMAYVIAPQATKRTLPPLVALIVIIIQSTTLASVIGTVEVLETAQRSIERLTFATGDLIAIPILGAVLILFFVICFPITLLGRWLERKLI
jgi:polar amino acid transport system permease protein